MKNKRNRIKQWLLLPSLRGGLGWGFFLLMGWGGVLYAQTYPVQITTQLATPFSGYIPDYTTAGNENLKLLILFTDFTKPSYNIKLKFHLSGQGINIQSKNYFYYGPVTLQPGIPIEISGNELAALLNPNNLDISGISVHNFQTQNLPEGYYNICFTAYDFNNPTPIQVSNESCAFGWMVLSDPPFVNLPVCGSTIPVNTPQNCMFQWTPMNMGSPNSVNNTVYDFALYEIRPSTQSPGNIIQTLPPIYQTTTSFAFINYGITEPQLYAGMQYVWRVRARDMSGRDMFKNQGFSQQCTFTYGSPLSQIDSNSIRLTLQGTALTYRLATYTWDSLAIFDSYSFQYRKQGTDNWFPINTSDCNTLTNNLEPATSYEARVQGIYADGNGPWSNTVTITTPAKPEVVCGQGAAPPLSENFIPLKTGTVGQTWNIGQFDMIVTQLDNPNDASGHYSGYGKIAIPFMLNSLLIGKFENISINEAMQMVEGEVEITSSGMEAWLENVSTDNYEAVDYTYNGDIDSLYIDTNGNIIIVDANGTSTSQTPSGYPYIVQDSNGDLYTISINGAITEQTGMSNINLTQDQKDVYKQALIKLKNDFPQSIISQLQQQKQQKENDLNTYLTNTTGINIQQLNSVNNTEDVIITEDEISSTNIASTSETNYKTAEYNYLLAKVCNIFAKSTLIDADYNLLANYIIIDAKKSYQYIIDELQKNKTKNEIAEVVKSEIKIFIEKTIKQHTFAKPQ